MIAYLLNLSGKQTFRIENVDKEEVIVEGQFLPEDIAETMTAQWAEKTGMGREAGYLQYVGGTADTLRFRVQFLSDTKDSLIETLNKIKSLVQIDTEFGRPPICKIIIGEYSFLGVFITVGDIVPIISRYGIVRGMIIDLTMREWVEYPTVEVKEIPPKLSIFKSPIYIVSENETWEHLGLRVYGDAMKGTALRYEFPHIELKAGIHLELPREIKRPKPFHVVWFL